MKNNKKQITIILLEHKKSCSYSSIILKGNKLNIFWIGFILLNNSSLYCQTVSSLICYEAKDIPHYHLTIWYKLYDINYYTESNYIFTNADNVSTVKSVLVKQDVWTSVYILSITVTTWSSKPINEAPQPKYQHR